MAGSGLTSESTASAAVTASVAAIVVNYRTEEHLAACLSALDAGTVRPTLVVVDNEGGSAEIKRICDLADATLITNDTNVGYPAACNQGATQSDAPFILFVNPDCVVDPDCLENLRDALLGDEQMALAGAAVRNVDGTLQRGTRRRLPTPGRIFRTITGLEKLAPFFPAFAGINVSGGEAAEALRVEAVSGALLMVRRSCFDALGGFDADYFLHVEDLDLFSRLQRAGHQLWYVPSAGATHIKGVSQRTQPVLASRYKHASLLRYLEKFHRRAVTGPVGWLLRATLWSHFVLTAPVLWLRAKLS